MPRSPFLLVIRHVELLFAFKPRVHPHRTKVVAYIGGDRLSVLIDAEMTARTDHNIASTLAHHTVGNMNR